MWLIVPSPGPAAISSGQSERDGEIAHGELVGERDEQAADSLDDQRLFANRRRACACDQAGGVDRLAREPRREMG